MSEQPEINAVGYAFPGLNAEFTGISSDGQERYEIAPSGGMTLRDYFAAKALAGQLASRVNYDDPQIAEKVARNCYIFADAMIAARGHQ